MAKLIISFKGATVAEHELRQGEMVIGRKPDCDIQIDSLAVSGKHAKVTTTGKVSVVSDMGSTNGTFINNQKITDHEFKNGDVVQIGKHTVTFVSGLASAAIDEDDELEKTVVLGAGAIPAPAPAQRPSVPAGHGAESTVATIGGLQMLNGPRVGQSFDLTKSLTNIGQKGKCAAVISRRGGGYHIAHMDGPMAPKVNGGAIGEQASKLGDGDVLEIGTVKMQFYLRQVS